MNIQSTTYALGTSDGAYTFPVNPVIYDPAPGYQLSEAKILHGASAWQKSAWDSRVRILEWRSFEVADATFSVQMDKMRTWRGKVRYFNFQNINSLNTNWPVSNTWKKCRVINILETFQPGGTLKFESVKLIIQPEV